jgi:predicted N-acetyltransferase YhbS
MDYEFRQLRESELPAWFDHLAIVFARVGREYFMNHWYQDPWASLSGIDVAMQQGEIASTVRTFTRTVHMGGAQVRMGGIGEVSTKEAHRRKGLSGQLLENALQHMRENEVGLSVLFTGNVAHYQRHGWEIVKTERWRYNSLPITFPGASDVQVRPINYAYDVEAVAAIHERTSAPLAGPLVRSNAYWWNWLRSKLEHALVAERDGKILAYLLSNRREDQVQIVEFGVEPEAVGALIALLNAVARPKSDAPSSMVIPAAMKQMLADALQMAPTPPERIEQNIMCRVVSPIALATQMRPVWEERLRTAHWQGTLTLDTGMGCCRLQMDDNGLRVSVAEADSAPSTHTATFTHVEFINLLYGNGEAAVIGECDTPEARTAVQALLPPVTHTWWAADGF